MRPRRQTLDHLLQARSTCCRRHGGRRVAADSVRKPGQMDTYTGFVIARIEGEKDAWMRVGYFDKEQRASQRWNFMGLASGREREWWEEILYDEAAPRCSITLI